MAELVAAVGGDEENVPPELNIVLLALSAPSHGQVIEVDEEPWKEAFSLCV